MAFNGAGVFVRLYNWVADRDASVNINATRMDAEMDGMATGLSNCITKDGQTVVTANLPMSGFKHTGVADGSARNHYSSIGQVQDGSIIWGGVAGGTADAITISLSPPISAYADGQRFVFVANDDNTTSVTLAVNGLSPISLVRPDLTDMQAGEILGGQVVEVVYYNSVFIRVLSSSVNSETAIIAAQVFS